MKILFFIILILIFFFFRYSGAFVPLAQQILSKIQFRQNREELIEFDDSAKDDDGETEWKKFLKACVELLAKIAEFQPLEILRFVVS